MPELSVEAVDLLRRWARGELSLSEGHTPDEARRAFLKGLDAAEFLPTAESRYALALLTADDASSQDFAALPRAAQRHLMSAFQAELEKFAQESRGLSPAERRESRLALTRKCAGIPTLLARVDRVASSLATRIEQFPDPQCDARALADELLAAGALPPVEHAIRRQASLATLSGEVVRWRTAAILLRDDYSDIAACDPRYVNYLATRATGSRLRRRRIAEAHRHRWRLSFVADLRKHGLKLFLLTAVLLGFALSYFDPTKPTHRPQSVVPSVVNPNRIDGQKMVQHMYEESQQRNRQKPPPQNLQQDPRTQLLQDPARLLNESMGRNKSALERGANRARKPNATDRLHILVPDRNGKQE